MNITLRIERFCILLMDWEVLYTFDGPYENFNLQCWLIVSLHSISKVESTVQYQVLSLSFYISYRYNEKHLISTYEIVKALEHHYQ